MEKPDHQTTADKSFVNRCEGQIYQDGLDLDDDDRLRLYRLAGHRGEPPNYRVAWPPYARMIADAREALKDG
jgi:hypothetical protein